jgi:hypothetical protein
MFHDNDKHASSGKFQSNLLFHLAHIILENFIYQNYRQALEKIQYDGEKLAVLSAQLEMTSTDYDGYLESEQDYLRSLQVEPIEITQMLDYMELLVKLYRLQYVSFYEPLVFLTTSIGKNLMRQSKHGASSIMTLFTIILLVCRLRRSEPSIILHILVGLLTMRRFANMKKNMELRHGGHLGLQNTTMCFFSSVRENTVRL